MQWLITADLITNPEDDDPSAVGVRTKGCDPECADLPFEFRIYDDDGIHYYSGRASEQGFGPLDWASGYAGATEIRYRQGHAWKRL